MLAGAVTGPTVASRVFDAQLMAAVVEGNCAAFEQLYDRHVRSCFGLAMRLVQEPCLAEDIVQEVFTRLWTRPTTFSPERGIFSAWLMRVVRNLALDKLRQAKSRSAMNIVPLNSDNTGSDTLVDLLPDTNPTPHDQVCTKDVAVVVRHALQQLPAPQYQAITLAYFGGLTQQEIADKLNLPLGTVKTRTRGALHRLHHLLGDHGVFQTE
jgi:RNA polymerase sigma-70 factor (ECF subfamily)